MFALYNLCTISLAISAKFMIFTCSNDDLLSSDILSMSPTDSINCQLNSQCISNASLY